MLESYDDKMECTFRVRGDKLVILEGLVPIQNLTLEDPPTNAVEMNEFVRGFEISHPDEYNQLVVR